MGTDIHAAIEFRKSAAEPWQAVMVPNKYFGKYDDESEFTSRINIERDYDVFAILGNVRNGYAFAGCVTGVGFEPISDNRGVPEDISEDGRKALSDEHSPTWVTLPELLTYDWTRLTIKTGIVGQEEFERWDRMKEWESGPRSYCGGVSGQRVKHISPDEMRERIKGIKSGAVQAGSDSFDYYTRLEWKESYAEAGKQLWVSVLPLMLKAAVDCGSADNVRLVMDFDS